MVVIISATGIRRGLARGSVSTGVSATGNVRRYVSAVTSLGSGGTRGECLMSLSSGVSGIRGETLGNRFNATIFISYTRVMLGLNVTAATLTNSTLLVGNRVSILAFFMFLLLISQLCSPVRTTLRGLTTVVDAGAGISEVGRVLSRSIRSNSSGLAGGNCSVAFSGMDFSCGGGRGILSGISFATGRKRVATLMNPSNNNGAAISELTTQF